MARRNSTQSYNEAYHLYQELYFEMEKFSNTKYKPAAYEIIDAEKKLDKFEENVDNIKIRELESTISPEKLRMVEKNLDMFKELIYVWKSNMESMEYFPTLVSASIKYMERLKMIGKLGDKDYDNISANLIELGRKFAEAITSPKNVNLYRSDIENIIKNKMSDSQFSRIFFGLKDKGQMEEMNPQKFKTLKKFKEENINYGVSPSGHKIKNERGELANPWD